MISDMHSFACGFFHNQEVHLEYAPVHSEYVKLMSCMLQLWFALPIDRLSNDGKEMERNYLVSLVSAISNSDHPVREYHGIRPNQSNPAELLNGWFRAWARRIYSQHLRTGAHIECNR